MDTESARAVLFEFAQNKRLAVIATATLAGRPEAALISIAVTPALEIVFETTSATRKSVNLAQNPRASLVVGWDSDRTLQLDGLVDAPKGNEHDRLKDFYLSVFSEKASHEFWPGNDFFRLSPYWARLSDYNLPRKVEEFSFPVDRSQYGTFRRNWWARLWAPTFRSKQHN